MTDICLKSRAIQIIYFFFVKFYFFISFFLFLVFFHPAFSYFCLFSSFKSISYRIRPYPIYINVPFLYQLKNRFYSINFLSSPSFYAYNYFIDYFLIFFYPALARNFLLYLQVSFKSVCFTSKKKKGNKIIINK